MINPHRNLTLSVFIDLTKAFDTISYFNHLNKLANLANKRFKSHVADINQNMNFGYCILLYEQLLCGIPPGSILGPISFLIHVNDIQNSCKHEYIVIAILRNNGGHH